LLRAGDDEPAERAPTPGAVGAESDPVITTLLIGTRHQKDGPKQVVWLDLLTASPTSERGSVVYVPAHTATEVPGHGGLSGIGTSLSSGGVPLLLTTTKSLLGPIDHYVEMNERDAALFVGALGELAVDVPSEVSVPLGDNEAELVIDSGLQDMAGLPLVDLLYTRGIGGDDAELGSRHLAFWGAVFDKYSEDPEALQKAVAGAGAALSESDIRAPDLGGILQALATLDQADRELRPLPTEQVVSGHQELYKVDSEQLAAFMASVVGEEVAEPALIRVQIQNGNGVPGIGQKVADKLVGRGFKIELDQNATSFDHYRTKIVTYDDSSEGLEAARKVKELLGVGRVLTHEVGQSIVDLTIVVGRDFLKER
jgi:polyisoprenyl-teichoic acid--peptidoglycan teichoic acid transferase